MGLQRDTTQHGMWTNSEGYSDGTAGAALNNIMREKMRTQPQTHPIKKDGTRLISVMHPKPKKPQPVSTKSEDELLLKAARTIFTIIQQVAQLKGMAVTDLKLQDKGTKREWSIQELTAPNPK